LWLAISSLSVDSSYLGAPGISGQSIIIKFSCDTKMYDIYGIQVYPSPHILE
jgi:hypothetical protein